VLAALFVLSTTLLAVPTNAEETEGRVTGNEEIIVSVTQDYYDRGSDITVTFTSLNLDPNTEYTIDWELCYGSYDRDCALYQMHTADSADDPAYSEGQVDLGSGSNFQVSTITFSDPGNFVHTPDPNGQTEGTYSGLVNESYSFKAILNVQGVFLHLNESEGFVLGGRVIETSSYLDPIANHLKNTEVNFLGFIRFDYNNYGILDYDIICQLFEDGVANSVDSSTMNWNFYDTYGYFSSADDGNSYGLTPTASSGTHHIECTVVRLVDNYAMHTLISNDFDIIDETITGNEEIVPTDFTTLYFDRSTTSSTTQIIFESTITDLYPGTTYNLDWELCYGSYDRDCALYQMHTADMADDPAYSEGQETFTATSSTETITITFDDPGNFVHTPDPNGQTEGTYSGLVNESYSFKAILNVQGVFLHLNESEGFVLGGRVIETSSYLDPIANHLKNTEVNFLGFIRFDYNNYGILDYDIICQLFEDGVANSVDSSTMNWNFYDTYGYFSSADDGNSYGLTPTASSGTHHIECTVVRLVDNYAMHTLISNDFDIIDDTSNQDDATISVSVNMHPTESWGTVVIDSIDLDPGQEYTLDWMVEDYSSGTPVLIWQNDHIWVEGTDGIDSYSLSFHDLPDTTDACITVVFSAGETELQTVTNVCWESASTADEDNDGVYDKDDQCPGTPTGSVVQADGCSDTDGDGFDTSYEQDCGTDPTDQSSFPTDMDQDGTCDGQDEDIDGDGYLNLDEIAAGTDPYDSSDKPANRLPTCAVYYTLEVEGIPTTFEGDAAIPALSGVSAQTAVSSLVPTTITIPEGNYYITAHCIDLDGDDITVTVNDITVGPMAGEVSAGAMIEIGEDVDETIDVQITWTDGTDTLTALVTVELDGDGGGSSSGIPGFGVGLAIVALISAGLIASRRDD